MKIPETFLALLMVYGSKLQPLTTLTTEDLEEPTVIECIKYREFCDRVWLTTQSLVCTPEGNIMMQAKQTILEMQGASALLLPQSLASPPRRVRLVKNDAGQVVGIDWVANGPFLRPHKMSGHVLHALSDGTFECEGEVHLFPVNARFELIDLASESVAIARCADEMLEVVCGRVGLLPARALISGAPQASSEHEVLPPRSRPTPNWRMWEVINRALSLPRLDLLSPESFAEVSSRLTRGWHWLVGTEDKMRVAKRSRGASSFKMEGEGGAEGSLASGSDAEASTSSGSSYHPDDYETESNSDSEGSDEGGCPMGVERAASFTPRTTRGFVAVHPDACVEEQLPTVRSRRYIAPPPFEDKWHRTRVPMSPFNGNAGDHESALKAKRELMAKLEPSRAKARKKLNGFAPLFVSTDHQEFDAYLKVHNARLETATAIMNSTNAALNQGYEDFEQAAGIPPGGVE